MSNQRQIRPVMYIFIFFKVLFLIEMNFKGNSELYAVRKTLKSDLTQAIESRFFSGMSQKLSNIL